MKIKLYQQVVLTQDLPEYKLHKGDIAMVVEHLPATLESEGEEGYALEVFNDKGETIDVVIVPASMVKPQFELASFELNFDPKTTSLNYGVHIKRNGKDVAATEGIIQSHQIRRCRNIEALRRILAREILKPIPPQRLSQEERSKVGELLNIQLQEPGASNFLTGVLIRAKEQDMSNNNTIYPNWWNS